MRESFRWSGDLDRSSAENGRGRRSLVITGAGGSERLRDEQKRKHADFPGSAQGIRVGWNEFTGRAVELERGRSRRRKLTAHIQRSLVHFRASWRCGAA